MEHFEFISHKIRQSTHLEHKKISISALKNQIVDNDQANKKNYLFQIAQQCLIHIWNLTKLFMTIKIRELNVCKKKQPNDVTEKAVILYEIRNIHTNKLHFFPTFFVWYTTKKIRHCYNLMNTYVIQSSIYSHLMLLTPWKQYRTVLYCFSILVFHASIN